MFLELTNCKPRQRKREKEGEREREAHRYNLNDNKTDNKNSRNLRCVVGEVIYRISYTVLYRHKQNDIVYYSL